MVILETAAIGAAGYGIYRGGEAGVKKGKEAHRDIQREKKRFNQRSGLREKANARTSRISEIVQMKQNGGAAATAKTGGGGAGAGAGAGRLSVFGFGSSGGGGATTTATTPTPKTGFPGSDRTGKTDINDRHRNVMEKLRASRQEEQKKKKSFNPFKKK